MGGRVELKISIANLHWQWVIIDKDDDICIGALRYDSYISRQQFAHCTGGMVYRTINFDYDDVQILDAVREAYNITED